MTGLDSCRAFYGLAARGKGPDEVGGLGRCSCEIFVAGGPPQIEKVFVDSSDFDRGEDMHEPVPHPFHGCNITGHGSEIAGCCIDENPMCPESETGQVDLGRWPVSQLQIEAGETYMDCGRARLHRAT